MHADLAHVELGGAALRVPYAELEPEIIGDLYESFLAHTVVRSGTRARLEAGRSRRQSGSFFTPPEMLALARDAGFRKVEHVSAAELTQRYFANRTDGLRPPNNSEELLVAS